jgi:hypothetical protein
VKWIAGQSRVIVSVQCLAAVARAWRLLLHSGRDRLRWLFTQPECQRMEPLALCARLDANNRAEQLLHAPVGCDGAGRASSAKLQRMGPW